MKKQVEPLIDIATVILVSGLAFFLEDFVHSKGWIKVGPEVRGVSSVLAGAIAAVVITFARGRNFSDLGFMRPKRWGITALQVAAILITFIAAQNLVPQIISIFIEIPDPDMSRYESISGNLGLAIAMAFLFPITASIPEEIIYRGFLMDRISSIFSQKKGVSIIAVFTQGIIFSLVHFQWGIGGMILTLSMGIIWGVAYLLCGRNLWVVILAHSGGHILFVIYLYLN